MILMSKITINKWCTLIEYIVIWLWVKYITFLQFILCLYLFLDYECHIAERQFEIFLEN